MTEVIKSAAELQDICQQFRWRYCFIGGLALQRWGEPRETVDVDLTLLTGFGEEEIYIAALLKRFAARIPQATEFALQHRVLLLKNKNGVGLDVALGGIPFEESAVQRSSMFEYPGGIPLNTCSAEDLIVMKAFASRGKDWVDIEGILVKQSENLDWSYIYEQLEPLAELKQMPEIVLNLKKIRVKFDG